MTRASSLQESLSGVFLLVSMASPGREEGHVTRGDPQKRIRMMLFFFLTKNTHDVASFIHCFYLCFHDVALFYFCG